MSWGTFVLATGLGSTTEKPGDGDAPVPLDGLAPGLPAPGLTAAEGPGEPPVDGDGLPTPSPGAAVHAIRAVARRPTRTARASV
jgi:hypothetical protein